MRRFALTQLEQRAVMLIVLICITATCTGCQTTWFDGGGTKDTVNVITVTF